MKSSRLFGRVCGDHNKDWRWQIKNLIQTPVQLEPYLHGTLISNPSASIDSNPWTMRVTPYYAGLIVPDDPDDPILRQISPSSEENQTITGDSMDPLAENIHSPVKGLIHRYKDRVLLLPSGFCPTLCRFCVRKRAWSENASDPDFDLEEALRYIKSHPEIRDVILSGGDPLFLPSHKLAEILGKLKQIPHVRIVRIGSRAPVTLPMRIDSDLVKLLRQHSPLWLITHFNHPREMSQEAKEALRRLIRSGIIVNNQSVLLKGVNDSSSVLIDLSLKLLESGVRPYYLHQVDRVKGVSHFHVPIEEGMEIVKNMFGKVSGLGIPRYILDLPEGKGKVPLMPDFLLKKTEKTRIYQAPLGGCQKI